MGFWEKAGAVLGDAAKDAVKNAQRKMERIEKYELRYENLSDEDLKYELKKERDSKNRNIEKMQAIINILQRRGY